MSEKLDRACPTRAWLSLPPQFSKCQLGLLLIKGRLHWPFSCFPHKDTVVGLKAWIFFYKIAILNVKAKAQVFIVRMVSTQQALVGECFGARPDMLSFMGRFKGSEIIPSVFERQAKGKSNIFTLFGLFAFLTYILLPQLTLSAAGWQVKSTSGVLSS